LGLTASFISSGTGLYAFSEWHQLWVSSQLSEIRASPAIAVTHIYVPGFGGGTLFAIAPTGEVNWSFHVAQDDLTNGVPAMTPAVASRDDYYPF